MRFLLHRAMNTPHDPRKFRNALGSFATGVTVITTRGPNGELIGNTASSFNSVSLDPPLVLWSLSRTAYSFKSYIAADYFAVNVLREGQDDFRRALPNHWATSGRASNTKHGRPAVPSFPTRSPSSNAGSLTPIRAATM